MAMNVNRWLKYAKARIDAAVGSGHESLDRLEAEREAERADKPWLGSDSTAPTFDEARARIAWEADQQAKTAARLSDGEQAEAEGSEPETKGPETEEPRTKTADAPGSDTKRTEAKTTEAARPSTPAGQATKSAEAGPAPRSPQQIAEDAERETARLELEDRQRKSAERLDQIRRELGIDDTPAP